MGLPFETPGGYEDDNTTPEAYTDDLMPADYNGYGQDMVGGHQDATGDDDFFEDEYDYEDDEPEEGDRAGWDPGADLMGGPDRR
jgi:hypothetical protein